MNKIKIAAVLLSLLLMSSSAWAWGKKCPKGQSWDKTQNVCVTKEFNTKDSARENTIDSRSYPAFTPGSSAPFSNDIGNRLPNTTYIPETAEPPATN